MQQPVPSRLESYSSVAHVPEEGDASPAATRPSKAQNDPALVAAYEAGRNYDERRTKALEHALAREFSPEIAALLQGPTHEAWSRLEQMALRGDRLAGDALEHLAHQCSALSGGLVRLSSRLQTTLSPEDGAYVAGALDHEAQVVDDFVAACRRHGLGWGRLAAMMGLPDPTTAAQWDDWTYRQAFFAEFAAAFAGGTLDPSGTTADHAMDRLTGDRSTAPADDLARAMAAADVEPMVLWRLASCLEHGCGQIPVLPAEELRPWQERAARAGSLFAVESLARADESSGALESAWAWAWFERWLASNSCSWEPRVLNYAASAEDLQRIAARLGPAARARAARLGADRIAQYGPQALAAHGCAG